MAAAGKSQAEAPPDATSRADLRRQAVRWLKMDLKIWSRMLASGSPEDRNLVLRAMPQWRKDTDLVAVRDAAGLASLPDACSFSIVSASTQLAEKTSPGRALFAHWLTLSS